MQSADAMHLDVVDLKAFYYRTRLGRAAQRSLRRQVGEFWPAATSETVAGYGFAAPLLRKPGRDARRVISLMPAQQGVMPWTEQDGNNSVLCEEVRWPLPTGFVDKLLVLHGLETSENPNALLDEIWRVLGPGGRVLFIVPNRSGLWARSDVTPFGYGRPYSLRQLETELAAHRFVPERHSGALFSPPSNRRVWLKVAPMWERVGLLLPSHLTAGAVLMEASKQVYAPKNKGLGEAVRRPLSVLDGIAPTPPEPVSGRG